MNVLDDEIMIDQMIGEVTALKDINEAQGGQKEVLENILDAQEFDSIG